MSERVWRPGFPVDPARVLGAHRRGTGDPSYAVDGAGAHWRAIRSPAGPVTLRVLRVGDEVRATAWGPGADWALAALPAMLGAADDPSGFEPRHPVLERAWRAVGPIRFGRVATAGVDGGGLVLQSLVPTILEQKVTGQEAYAGYRALVHRFGEVAPGPTPRRRSPEHRTPSAAGLRLPPDAAALAAIPSWDWIRLPVGPQRSDAVARAVRVAPALERLAALTDPAEFDRRLRTVPGLGEWTSAEVRRAVLGDPDAVSFGDYHVAADLGWALTGAPVDDDGLRELLAPWAGHRARVQALVFAARLGRPRRGARMAPRTHLPTRRRA